VTSREAGAPPPLGFGAGGDGDASRLT